MTAVVISPHLDDAVLSCGQLMAGWEAMTVVTVCAGVPDDGFVSRYDADSGFTTSRKAMVARRQEDRAAMATLKARAVWLDFMDGAYPNPPRVERVTAGLLRLRHNLDFSAVFMPAGISHPIHELVAEACREMCATNPIETMWVYEELPYRVNDPVAAAGAIGRWRDHFDIELDFAGTGPMDIKEKAVGAYTSQLWALNERCLFVPERFWRIV